MNFFSSIQLKRFVNKKVSNASIGWHDCVGQMAGVIALRSQIEEIDLQ